MPRAEDPAPGWPVIALVASAGGLEAVTSVLAGLPSDFGASVLVLIHSQPDRPSEVANLLGRRTPLPVTPAEEGTVLCPGQVFVAPPGSHTLVDHALRVVLVVSGDAPPSRPSADLLLTTLALAAGPRAIGVILSGGGHDGATGATAVHDLGGTVLATDEASSTVFSMPQAAIARDHIVDQVVALDDVAARLGELAATRR